MTNKKVIVEAGYPIKSKVFVISWVNQDGQELVDEAVVKALDSIFGRYNKFTVTSTDPTTLVVIDKKKVANILSCKLSAHMGGGNWAEYIAQAICQGNIIKRKEKSNG